MVAPDSGEREVGGVRGLVEGGGWEGFSVRFDDFDTRERKAKDEKRANRLWRS